MVEDDDLVLRTFIRSKLGMDLPPSISDHSMIDSKTLTDNPEDVTSIGNSLFMVGHGHSENDLLDILSRSREEISEMIDSIEDCQRSLDKLR